MALQYKLVSADFDSTLTNSAGKITDRTRRAVKAYREAGGIFIINTGRSYKSLKPRLCEVYGDDEANVPVSCQQGGRIHAWDGSLIKAVACDIVEVMRVAEFAEDAGLYFQVYSGDRLFTEKPAEIAAAYERVAGTKQEFVGRLTEFLKTYGGGIDKLLIIADPDEIAALYGRYSRDGSFSRIKFVYSTSLFLEAIPVESGKDSAHRLFAEMYGVPLKETAAIGDSNNDLPMIIKAGLGVAMGNGVKELIAAADMVAEDNDHDGLAVFLESITQ